VREIVADGHAPARELSTDAMDELFGQEWPGNIRQLRTTIFRALVLARGAVVRLHDVRLALAGGSSVVVPGLPKVVVDEAPDAQSGVLRADALPGESALASAPIGGDPLVARGGQAISGRGLGNDRSASHGVGSVEGDGESGRGVGPRVSSREVSASGSSSAAAEPVVELVRPDAEAEAGPILTPRSKEIDPPDSPAASGKDSAVPLPPRLLQLRSLIQERGRLTTQDHMTSSGVSHRTALRDLQALVQYGVVERVGARRGAFYRPSGASANSVAPDSTNG
jgi:hypothetical protein